MMKNAADHGTASSTALGFLSRGILTSSVQSGRQIRRPKAENRRKSEIRNPKPPVPALLLEPDDPERRDLPASATKKARVQCCRVPPSDFDGLRLSGFGFPSVFGFRPSDFISAPPFSSATTLLPTAQGLPSSTTSGPRPTVAGGRFAAPLPSDAQPRTSVPDAPPSPPRRR